MARRKNIRKSPHYHSRLFVNEEDAERYVERMKIKMGTSEFIFDVSYNEQFELYHGRFWNRKDHDDYIH